MRYMMDKVVSEDPCHASNRGKNWSLTPQAAETLPQMIDQQEENRTEREERGGSGKERTQEEAEKRGREKQEAREKERDKDRER